VHSEGWSPASGSLVAVGASPEEELLQAATAAPAHDTEKARSTVAAFMVVTCSHSSCHVHLIVEFEGSAERAGSTCDGRASPRIRGRSGHLWRNATHCLRTADLGLADRDHSLTSRAGTTPACGAQRCKWRRSMSEDECNRRWTDEERVKPIPVRPRGVLAE
jgi:hypothetical protein